MRLFTSAPEFVAAVERHAQAMGTDPLGDDQAERHSAWGSLPDCAEEGGEFREPSQTYSPTRWQRFLRWLLNT